jgi:hypothetical protein
VQIVFFLNFKHLDEIPNSMQRGTSNEQLLFLQAYMSIRHYSDALKDFNKAITLNAPKKINFLRGVVNLLLEVSISYLMNVYFKLFGC